MWPFKRKPEPPAQIKAEKALDEVTREVAWEEFDKAEGRGALGLGIPDPPAAGDPDPGGERGLRDALKDDRDQPKP